MLEPLGHVWGKEALEIRLVDQAKETGDSSYFPDSSGSSHWGVQALTSYPTSRHQCSTYLSLSASMPLTSPHEIDLCCYAS